MTTKTMQLWQDMKDAELAVVAAQEALTAAQERAAAALRLVKVGERVPAKTGMSGIACTMEVISITCYPSRERGVIHLQYNGKRVNKNGTLSAVYCYIFDTYHAAAGV